MRTPPDVPKPSLMKREGEPDPPQVDDKVKRRPRPKSPRPGTPTSDGEKPKRKKDTARPHLSLSAFQRVSRDFAFVINEDVTAEMITSAANKVDKELITETDVFDVFAGGNLEEGKKSMALSITLQPMDRTLTDAEIEEIAKKVVASVTKATGAALRM